MSSNPFRADLPADRNPEPATVVIFGASGDLTKRKLVPALYSLASDHLLPRLAIVGSGRSELTDDAFRASMREGLDKYARKPPAARSALAERSDAGTPEPVRASLSSVDDDIWSTFGNDIFYQSCSFDEPEDFVKLKRRLEAIEKERGLPGNRLFYLSTPPTAFAPIIKNLGAAGLVDPRDQPYARVIIEKPFGTDLASARALNREVRSVLEEKQIFRIDHYLGKETVQNLLVFRFANGIFEPLWNSKYVDHVQITGAETLGATWCRTI
jgi:glucose-6-phosphate 1-dehydrogenase